MNKQNFNELKRLSRLIWLMLNNEEKAHYLNDVGIIALIEKTATIAGLDLNRDDITANQFDDIIKSLAILDNFHKFKNLEIYYKGCKYFTANIVNMSQLLNGKSWNYDMTVVFKLEDEDYGVPEIVGYTHSQFENEQELCNWLDNKLSNEVK